MSKATRRAAHHCHAVDCETHCKPEMLFCLRHWRMVPPIIQRRVWATYRPGQCDDMSPSNAWHDAADEAIAAVAWREMKPAKLPGSRVRGSWLRAMRAETLAGFYA